MNALKTRARMRGQGGFTLIELLIVIAILGILAGVVVYAVGGTTDSAKKNACKTERGTVETALEAYKADSANDSYPTTLTYLEPKYLKKAPSTSDFGYTSTGPAVTAITGGKYKNVYADCNL